MIKKNNQTITSVYKGTTEIARIFKGLVLVFENAKTFFAAGFTPLFLYKCIIGPLLDYKIYGDTFTELEYIQSTGTQYIDTDVTASNSLTITGTFAITNLSNTSNYIIGCYANNNVSRIQFSYASTPFFGWGSTYNNTSSLTTDTNKHDFSLSSTGFTIDGTTVFTPDTSTFTTAVNVFIFGRNGAGTPGLIPDGLRVYNVTIADGGTVIRNFVPCKYGDETGMYDTAQGKFYPNKGAGDFVTGPIVGSIGSVGDKTINLLDIYGRTEGFSSGSSNTNPRTFDYTKYYVGFTSNNYYVPANVVTSTLSNGVWTIEPIDSGHSIYGVGFPIPVEASKRYYVIGEYTGRVSVGYFDANGTYLSQTSTVTTSFLTPANAVTALIVLNSAAKAETTFKNMQATTTSTSTYYPYGYAIPIKRTGKNLLDITNVVRSNNLDYTISGNEITFTPNPVTSTSGNYYINLGDYADFAGKTIYVSAKNDSTSARVQLWLRYTNGDQTWSSSTSIANKDVYAGTTNGYSVYLPQNTSAYQLMLRLYVYQITQNTTIKFSNIQIEYGDTMTSYEAYQTPERQVIYLDEPLRKIGSGIPSVLPTGYTQVAYLETDGSQYIDTNVTCSENSQLECMFSSSSTSTAIMGAQESGSGATLNFGTLNNSRWGTSTKLGYVANLDGHIHYMVYNKNGLYDNGVSVFTPTASTFTTGNIYVSRVNGAGTYTANRIYRARIWNNNKLVRDLVPAKNSSDVLGMYDLVSNTFFTNAGTGTFTSGGTIYADYLDYANQKIVRNVQETDGVLTPLVPAVEQSVTLPSVTVNQGLNIFDVPTTIPPSNIEIKYKGR